MAAAVHRSGDARDTLAELLLVDGIPAQADPLEFALELVGLHDRAGRDGIEGVEGQVRRADILRSKSEQQLPGGAGMSRLDVPEFAPDTRTALTPSTDARTTIPSWRQVTAYTVLPSSVDFHDVKPRLLMRKAREEYDILGATRHPPTPDRETR